MCNVLVAANPEISRTVWEKRILPRLKEQSWVSEAIQTITLGFTNLDDPRLSSIMDGTPSCVLLTEDCTKAIEFTENQKSSLPLQLLTRVGAQYLSEERIIENIADTLGIPAELLEFFKQQPTTKKAVIEIKVDARQPTGMVSDLFSRSEYIGFVKIENGDPILKVTPYPETVLIFRLGVDSTQEVRNLLASLRSLRAVKSAVAFVEV
ncbi:hypothetical protein BH09PAT1_BH09PAT1_4240 [soil metagenome]